MIKKQQIFYLLLFTIIASNSFFQFKLFQSYDSILKFVYYFFLLIAIVLAFVISSNKQNRIKYLFISKQPILLVLSLFVGTLLSVWNAFIYKEQPLAISLMTSLQTLSVYFLFFALIGLGFTVEQFEKLIVWMGITYIVILFIGYLTLPNPIFGIFAIEEGRGGIRFRLSGYFWTVALYFYSIQQFRDKGEMKFLAFIALCLLATILTFARQYIAYSLVLGFVFYLTGISLSKKLIIIALGVFFTLFVIPNTKLYQNYSNITQEQLERNKYEEEDVRVKDYRIFLFDYPRTTMQYLFGCGLASYGNSRYGEELEFLAKTENLIQVDTGWGGFVFYYGYIGTALLLLIILKSLFLSCHKRFNYLKYLILYMSLCSILGGTILFYHEYLIIFFSIYILSRVSSMEKIRELVTSVINYITLRCLENYRSKKTLLEK